MQSSFNKYRLKGAYHYDWLKNEAWYQYMVYRAVEFCQGSTLDVGCGDGVLAKLISENAYSVTGIDSDKHAIELAEKLAPEAEFRLQGIGEGVDGTWDYLACLHTIEHLDKPEVLLDILKKNIRKGAIITTIEWQGGSLGEDHKREYSMRSLVDLFEEYKPKRFRIPDTEFIGIYFKI